MRPWWKLLTNDRSVVIFYRSCDYISYMYLPWTSEYSLAETGNSCCITAFWLSAALISFSCCLLVCCYEINKQSEALRSRSASDPIRSHTLKWINIIVLRTLRRKNYSCGLLRVIYLSEKTEKQVTCRFAIQFTGYLGNWVYFHIAFFSLLVVDCQLEILEFLVIYNDVIDRQRLVLIGNSKLFLARLASQARRASSWFVLSLWNWIRR